MMSSQLRQNVSWAENIHVRTGNHQRDTRFLRTPTTTDLSARLPVTYQPDGGSRIGGRVVRRRIEAGDASTRDPNKGARRPPLRGLFLTLLGSVAGEELRTTLPAALVNFNERACLDREHGHCSGELVVFIATRQAVTGDISVD